MRLLLGHDLTAEGLEASTAIVSVKKNLELKLGMDVSNSHQSFAGNEQEGNAKMDTNNILFIVRVPVVPAVIGGSVGPGDAIVIR